MLSFNPKEEVVYQDNSTKSIRKIAQMYIDGELLQNQQVQFQSLIQKDERYQKIYNAEKNFKSLIKNNVKRSAAQPGLADTILDMISGKVGSK